MGWGVREHESNAEQMSIEKINAVCNAAANELPPAPDSHREGIDWIRTENGDLRHPL
jgi:hypothetical protein